MKKFITLLFAAVIVMSEAQIQTPAASPSASVSTVVGLTDVKINYSRPRAKGRKIFGEGDAYLLPYGKIWRTGANSSTKISFSDDVTIEGNKLPKGEYSIFSWPGATEWTISIHKDLNAGEGNYKKENDVFQFKVKPEKLTERVETFTINISDIADNSTSAKVQIAWENTSVKFTFGVDFDSKVMKSIEAGTKVSANNYSAAASYYFENGKDLKKALEWITLACNEDPNAFWNLLTKAKIQKALGDKAGATATSALSRAAAEKAGNAGYVKMNDDLMKTLK
jgi:hypothetical protein